MSIPLQEPPRFTQIQKKTGYNSVKQNPSEKKASIPIENADKAVDDHPLADFPHYYRKIRFDYRFYDDVEGALLHTELRNKKDHLAPKLKSHSPMKKFSDGLPKTHSLKTYIKTVLNQGNLGACVAHSAAQAINIVSQLRESKLTVAPPSKSWFRFTLWNSREEIKINDGFRASRLFIYDSARIEDGTNLLEDVGCTNLSACLGLDVWKTCSENVWPYNEEKFSIKPPEIAYNDAKTHTKFHYSSVDQSFESIALAIANNHPIMFGIQVYPSMVKSGLDGGRGNVPLPSSRERIIGGHSLLAIAYDLDSRTIEFVNHWGTEWGNGGFGSIPAEYLENRNLAGDFWAIESFE